ncbi:MAG: DMT family transporter [Rhodobacteraceae bacterium]|nr:DMT family transporter [Paracoccaceae bacterium]
MLSRETSARPARGIALNVAALFVLMCMAALVKAASDHVPTGQAVFARAFFSLPVILIWIALQGPLMDGLRMAQPRQHLLRGLLGTAALSLNFLALASLPLPEVTTIGFAAPLMTLVFAVLLLGEKVRLFRWTAVAIGFAGVVIVVWPNLSLDGNLNTVARLGALAALGSACCAALVKIVLRRMVATETTPAIVFWFATTASALALLTLPFGWVIPPLPIAALLVAAGVLGGIGQLMMTASYRFADASALAPLWYVQLLFASLIGYLFFAELPTSATLMGAVLVILSGLLILWRESKLARGTSPRQTPL